MSIKNFTKFYSDLALVKEKFDCITMIHVLEHIEDPSNFLQKVSERLSENGVLIIQVPRINTNPFDIFVYDHVSHFGEEQLFSLCSRVFKHCTLTQGQLYKEITIVCSNKALPTQADKPLESASIDIQRIQEALSKIDSLSQPISVFGTSPISTFCALLLGNKFEKFYDEDPNKQNCFHLNKKICSPAKYSGERVLLPFFKLDATKIKKRLHEIDFIEIFD